MTGMSQPHGIPLLDDADLNVRAYLELLQRRKWVIITSVIVCVGAAIALAVLTTKVYAASADVRIVGQRQELVLEDSVQRDRDPERELNTQIEIIKSRPIEEEVERRLGEQAHGLSSPEVVGVGESDLIRITVESADPAGAQAGANAYASAFVDQQQENAVETLNVTAEGLRRAANEAKAQLDAIEERIADEEAGLQNRSSSATTDSLFSSSPESLRAERDALFVQYGEFQRRADQLEVEAALREGGVRIVSEAELPDTPVRPAPIRWSFLGLILGLTFGVGLAFLRDHLDDSVKGADDVERHGGGAPVLAAVPVVQGWRNGRKPMVVALNEPKSQGAESYRSLRTNIQFMGLRQPLRRILVTSPMPGDGKTTTLANLAVTFALSGKKVIMVCCDLRRPRLFEFFGLSNTIGFTSVLLGQTPLSLALQDVPIHGGSLRLLPSGPLPPNPSELLTAPRAGELLQALQAEADVVLIDSPPLLPVTDALVLSGEADGVLVVTTVGKTSKKDLSRLRGQAAQVEAPLIGFVLNGCSEDAGYGGGYYGEQGTSPREVGSRKGRRSRKGGQADDLASPSGRAWSSAWDEDAPANGAVDGVYERKPFDDAATVDRKPTRASTSGRRRS